MHFRSFTTDSNLNSTLPCEWQHVICNCTCKRAYRLISCLYCTGDDWLSRHSLGEPLTVIASATDTSGILCSYLRFSSSWLSLDNPARAHRHHLSQRCAQKHSILLHSKFTEQHYLPCLCMHRYRNRTEFLMIFVQIYQSNSVWISHCQYHCCESL